MSLLVSGALLWLGHGLLLTYLPIDAKQLGFSEWQVGLTGSFYFLGFVTGCILTPHILHRVGHIRSFAVLAALYVCIVLLLAVMPEFLGWLALRFFIGASISGLYMIFESWLSEQSTISNRGSVLSVYTMLNLSMIAAGQQLLHLPVAEAGQYYLVAAMLIVSSIIPVSLTQSVAPTVLKRTKINLAKVWKYSHVGLLGAIASGLVTGSYWAMAPVYGEAIGMGPSYIAWFLSASVLGGAIFQYPFGRLSDQMDRRVVLQWLALLATLICVLMFFATRMQAQSQNYMVFLAFLWGGLCLTMYAISLAHANDYAQASEFVEISSSMLITLGVSSAAGAALASVSMKLVGPPGLYAFMAAVLFLFTATVFVRRKMHRLPEMQAQDNFQTVPGMATPIAYELDPRQED